MQGRVAEAEGEGVNSGKGQGEKDAEGHRRQRRAAAQCAHVERRNPAQGLRREACRVTRREIVGLPSVRNSPEG